MSNEEGTPKRRRGLFRRDRATETDTEPRLAADGFDDPWSASAWDDWDDDFTAGNLRSSVPAAAAPRPEAVDAWLQSEADDFDTATRLNAKRWGGEANREPATGLSSMRQSPPQPQDSSTIRALPVDPVPAAEVPAPEVPVFDEPVADLAEVEVPVAQAEVPVAEFPQIQEPLDEPPGEGPTWEPVAEHGVEVVDYGSDGDLDDVLDSLVDSDRANEFHVDDAEKAPSFDEAVPEPERDELLEIDEIEPSDEFTEELAVLDSSPTELPLPVASWAPVDTIEVRLPPAAESSTVDDRRRPAQSDPSPAVASVPPQSRFVSVSVVEDESPPTDHVATAVDALPAPAEAPDLDVSTGVLDGLIEPDSVATPPVEVAPPAPSGRSRRWADLAAEFGSDGDLEDSFPRKSRPTEPVHDPRAQIAETIHEHGPSQTVEDEPFVEDEPVVKDEFVAAPATPSPENRVPDEVDPWSLPPVRAIRRPADVEPPIRSRIPTTSDGPPELASEGRGNRPAHRPSTTPHEEAVAVRPVRPAVERPPLPAVAQRASTSSISPEFPSFAGVIGSALVTFAVARLVLALLGDQPNIPGTMTGTSARLVRLGTTFANIGTSWPLALLVGTVLLLLPLFAGFHDHLHRWAPMVGLATVTSVFAVLIGALQFYAGNKLGSPSTLRLLSDVIVGPIGFGLLTLVAVAAATRAHRR